MVKKVIRASEGRIVQFKYIDGIDGPQTQQLARSLGLSTNGSISKLWEVQIHGRWQIVGDGDYLVIENEMQVA